MSLFRDYLGDKRGNMSMYLGVAILTMFMGIGCAFDISQISAHKTRLNDLADTTALAAAIVARDGDSARMQIARDYFEANKDLSGAIEVDIDPTINFDDSVKEVTVEVTAEVKYAMMGMFGFSNPTVVASSTVNYMIDDVAPLSIAFAFDTSGSMGWLTTDGQVKMEALQAATDDLFTELYDASERPDLLEDKLSTAFSSYNRELVDSESMTEGHDHIVDAVEEMVADGGTNSTPSLSFALDELNQQKAAESDNRWAGYVVFMTDGDNNTEDADGNPVDWDVDSQLVCDQLRAANYRVFTVAFEAPANGQALLEYCATDSAHYFDSSNATDLKDAFKMIGRQLGESTVRLKS